MDDTIVAISTALKDGAISIVRVTGAKALNYVNMVFTKDLTKAKSHTIHYGHIKYKDELIDEVLVMVMRSPRTYTTEDVIEINCHGGLNSTRKVLEVLLQIGCRLAEPGEFTKRAYLNGRINLLEAESVNDLIIAKTDASRTLALNNVGGKLTQKIKNIRSKIAKILANIEVNIDYPEYTDELEVTKNLLTTYLKDIKEELLKLLNGAKSGQIIKNGINIAIIGKPNVGKSSILNHLIDEEKAIVTNIPGTTRDIVEGSITLNGVLVNFVDTAGIRQTEDVVEKIGVTKSEEIAKKADLIILVLNNNEELSKEEESLYNKYNADNLIVFVNKSDLSSNLDVHMFSGVVYGNTVDLYGLEELKNAIISKLNLEEIVNKDMSYLTNVREIDLVNKAYQALENALTNSLLGLDVDLIEIDLKEVWDYLGEVTGETYKEELVDEIFRNFCLGK